MSGVETTLVLARPGDTRDVRGDRALGKAIVRGRDWFECIASGPAESFAEIAREEGVTGRYVAHAIPLPFLAPGIVASILCGTQSVDLTVPKRIKWIDLPLDWAEQRAVLGFDA